MLMNLSPQEMVRIELLRYENPGGLHPVESQWRDLARKLLLYSEQLQQVVIQHHDSSYTKYRLADECPVCSKAEYKPIRFPTAFKPIE